MNLFKATYQIGCVVLIGLSSSSTICLPSWAASLSAGAPSQTMPAIALLKLMNLHPSWTQPHPSSFVYILCLVWFVFCKAQGKAALQNHSFPHVQAVRFSLQHGELDNKCTCDTWDFVRWNSSGNVTRTLIQKAELMPGARVSVHAARKYSFLIAYSSFNSYPSELEHQIMLLT